MVDAVIVDAVRTPSGGRYGGLSGWHPVDLAAEVLAGLARRNNLDPAVVDDVIMGCAVPAGAQAANIARSAALAAGFPESVPGTTVDRQCGSSLQVVHFAAQGVLAGAYDVVIAAGVEVMSLVPMGATSSVPAVGKPYGPRLLDRFALLPQGQSAELVARRWGLARAELDRFALRSHQRARVAATEGWFGPELVPVAYRRRDRETGTVVERSEPLQVDETIRVSTLKALAALRPVHDVDGVVTAGNTAPIADGASAVLIMSAQRAAAVGCQPRARFRGFAVVGADPLLALTASIPATATVLERAGVVLDDVDLIEIHEGYAAGVLAWAQELQPDMDRVNVSGGAIALGHAVGNSGTRTLATLLGGLERTGGRYGLQAMGEAGGTANALIIERLG